MHGEVLVDLAELFGHVRARDERERPFACAGGATIWSQHRQRVAISLAKQCCDHGHRRRAVDGDDAKVLDWLPVQTKLAMEVDDETAAVGLRESFWGEC